MYYINLSNEEITTLGWAVQRGYFPAITFDELTITKENLQEYYLDEEQGIDNSDKKEYKYELPEFAAWEITRQREENSHSLYSCFGGKLLQKLLKLESEIV